MRCRRRLFSADLGGGAKLPGGIGLLVPRTVRTAAMGLIIILIGAVFTHAIKIPNGLTKGVPAITSLLLVVALVLLPAPRRGQQRCKGLLEQARSL